MSSLKIIIPILIITILIGAGVYTIYKAQTTPKIVKDTNQSFPSPAPTASPQVKSANPPANQPATGPGDELEIHNIGIQLISPQPLSKITSPVQISGTANVTSQIVQINIYDSNGTLLGSGQAAACVGLDACQFEASISFSTPTTKTGSIEVSSPSTTGGTPTFLQSITVSF